MSPFESFPTTTRVQLIVHVYPKGGIDVRYAAEDKEAPFQAAALFGSRTGLAKTLTNLRLQNEANTVIHDVRNDHTFLVANTPELVKAFGFDEVGKLVG